MSHYGATNEGEFFAVAVEAFYEKPLQLMRSMPDVYRHLSEILKRDPVAERLRYEREQA